MNSIRTNLHELLKSTRPNFADERLDFFDRSELNEVDYTTTTGSVDLSKVKETDHSDYYNKTWIELLPTNPDDFKHIGYWEQGQYQGKMKRGWQCIQQMRKNPEYYRDSNEKEHWSFAKVGNYYYITQGNHRTVMARFLLSLNNLPEIVHGVSITEYDTAEMAPPPHRMRRILQIIKRWFVINI